MNEVSAAIAHGPVPSGAMQPVGASGKILQTHDFSVVLAGAAQAASGLATPGIAVSLPADPATSLLIVAGTHALPGSRDGKILPAGKLPVACNHAATLKLKPHHDDDGGSGSDGGSDGDAKNATDVEVMVASSQTSDGSPPASPIVTIPAPIAVMIAVPALQVPPTTAATVSVIAAAPEHASPARPTTLATTLATTLSTSLAGFVPVVMVARPDSALVGATSGAPVILPDAAVVPPPAVAVTEAAEHRHGRAGPVVAAEPLALLSRPEPMPTPATPVDLRTAATLTSAPAYAPNAPSAPPQDIAVLVDRIAEARAAALPDVVRAALVHEDFGAVSLNFRAETSHVHVTLGSTDPGFAPAVQAAAAAAMTGSTGSEREEHAPAHRPAATGQDAAMANNASSLQQASRDGAPADERGAPRGQPFGRHALGLPERRPLSPAPQRRTGIYA